MLIQIRRDGLYNQKDAVVARTEMSPQKYVRDAISQKIFGFEPFVSCEEKEAKVWIRKAQLTEQNPTDLDLAVSVSYQKPEQAEEYLPFKEA